MLSNPYFSKMLSPIFYYKAAEKSIKSRLARLFLGEQNPLIYELFFINK